MCSHSWSAKQAQPGDQRARLEGGALHRAQFGNHHARLEGGALHRRNSAISAHGWSAKPTREDDLAWEPCTFVDRPRLTDAQPPRGRAAQLDPYGLDPRRESSGVANAPAGWSGRLGEGVRERQVSTTALDRAQGAELSPA
jgi:hypothetical protein